MGPARRPQGPPEREVTDVSRQEKRTLFCDCLTGLANDATVEQMRDISQHAPGVSCYDHCLFVAYLSFAICRVLGLDYRAAARGGMLHDLYLQHWEDTDVRPVERLFVHPQMALENARGFGLSPMEEDIISKHMWPLTRPLPRYRESYVVGFADKLAATVEMTRLTGPLGVRRVMLSVSRAAVNG